MRLNKYIAQSGVCSRRRADELITSGRVKVNDEVIRTPGVQVKENDRVSVDHQPLRLSEYVYLLMNKPKGVTSTLSDPFARKKIVDLVPEHLGRLYPVGRLDKNSRGLIILTNDGELCHHMTHPRFSIEKEYRVTVAGEFAERFIDRLCRGVREGGELLKVNSARIIKEGAQETTLTVIVHEGKKRHLRRLFGSLGYAVIDLKRIRIGNIRLGTLGEGEFKIVPGRVVRRLVDEATR